MLASLFSMSPSIVWFTVTFLLAFSPTLAQKQPFNCAIFADQQQPFPCRVSQNQHTVGDSQSKVTIYHYVRGFNNDEQDKEVLDAIKTASKTVLPLWKRLSKPLDVSFLLVSGLNKNYGGLTTPSDDYTECYVQIPAHYPKGHKQSTNDLLGNIAHELYHCIEFRNAPDRQRYDKPSGWYFEGIADYFGNLVYPPLPSQRVSDWVRKYDPSQSLLTQSYEASLFWQYARQIGGWSNDDITTFERSQPNVQTDVAERKRVSSLGRITSLFPGFAAAFRDGRINFEDGDIILTDKEIRNEEIFLQLAADTQKLPFDLSVKSFTMKTYTTRVWPGQKIKLTFKSPHDGLVLQYRRADEPKWRRLTDPATIEQSCTDGDAQYIFLLTSTADRDVVTGTLTFERLSMALCKCEPSTTIRVDPCLVGEWRLDLASYKQLVRRSVQQGVSAPLTIQSVTATGAHRFSVTRERHFAMVFAHLHTSVAARSGGFNVRSVVDVNGKVDAGLVMQKFTGAYCLKDAVATGQVRASANGIPFNQDLRDAYGREDLYVRYRCSKDDMEVEGWSNGARAYIFNYVRV